MRFYTNFLRHKGYVLLRGYEFGNKFQKKIHYKPTLYIATSKDESTTPWRTLDGRKVINRECESMYEAYEFIKKYEDVDNIELFGSTNYEYACINEIYRGQVQFDPSLVAITALDIETDASGKFPNIQTANKAITAITLKRGGRIASIGLKDYKPHLPNVEYYKCENEHALLEKFLELWESRYFAPDILTGWNIDFFDLPYLVNRITRLFGEDTAKRLSPWRILESREIEIKGRVNTVYMPAGIAILDYMRLYKKFSFKNQESYTLDFIAGADLENEKKVDYKSLGYESLDDLYKRNHQLYIEYNIQDVVLVDKLEEKHKFLQQVMTIAYDGKVNYEDTLSTVRMWDTIIHNYLLDQNIVVPHVKPSRQHIDIVGGYVKEPKPAMYDWVVSFDLTSLYPHLIMQYNISPETFRGKLPQDFPVDGVVRGSYDKVSEFLKENNVTITPNSCIYTREKQGFLPALMEKMFTERDKYKQLMIEAKKKYEETKDPEWKNKVSAYHNLQLAKKIQLNSAYGALGNKYFRWFSTDLAEAITTSGQLSIKWIETRMNQHLNKLLKTEGADYVIACDTDSMYVNLDKLVCLTYGGRSNLPAPNDVVTFLDTACKKKLEPFIASCYEDLAGYSNAYQQKMHMKRENIAEKAVWTGKKHYVMLVWDSEGVRYAEPQMKMVGIEAVRSSTPGVCRVSIKKALYVLMAGGKDPLINYINEFQDEFSKMSFEEVAFPRGLSGMDDYKDASSIYKKGTPMQVRASLMYNHLILTKGLDEKYEPLSDGDKIKFCYLKKPNPTRENVIATLNSLPPEFGLERYIDYDTQFEKAFLDPIKTITDVLGWDLTNSSTLENFFG